jgi:hypothetical protein
MTETDRELLELAAKAEGRTLKYMTQHIEGREPEEFIACWNPLTDDGDALRLAVKLRLDVLWADHESSLLITNDSWDKHLTVCQKEYFTSDPYAATRRAIVRAAAEIGKAMP